MPTSEAALELGLLLKMLGRPEGTTLLTRVADSADTATRAPDLARSARALRALGRFNEANAAYRDAATAASRDPGIQTGWGELFLEGRCQTCSADAVKSFQAALKEDAKWTPAALGLALAVGEDDPPQSVELAKKVLELNPSLVEAHLLIAAENADAGHRDEARESIQKALDVNPSSLEAHALLAALAYVEDKPQEFEAEIAKILAIAPKLRRGLSRRRRTGVAQLPLRRSGGARSQGGSRSTLASRACWPTWARTCCAPATSPRRGRRSNRRSRTDPFDVVTYNLLQMMDTLDQFVTVREGDLIVRMHKDEAPVLHDACRRPAKQAMETLTKRYQFTPKGPILIEMFPKHDDFAVRNVGLPGMIGALGACFGRVVTLDSPRARPPGEFQWEATLWHELAHVVTLQMSNQRVPRWLTEGISVYEETTGAARVGAWHGRRVRRAAQSRRDAEAREPQRRVHRIPGRSGSPTSRRRSWSSTSWPPTATRGCTSCCAPTARGSRRTRR